MGIYFAMNDNEIEYRELLAIERHIKIEQKRKKPNQCLLDLLQKRADEINLLFKNEGEFIKQQLNGRQAEANEKIANIVEAFLKEGREQNGSR